VMLFLLAEVLKSREGVSPNRLRLAISKPPRKYGTFSKRPFVRGQVTEHPGHSIDHSVASDATSRTVKVGLFPDT
jgi:hypothetical protein